MKVSNIKIVLLIATVGLISACGSQAAATASASQPPVAAVVVTETSANTPAATQVAAAASVSFANDVEPLLSSRCVTCHGGDRTEKNLSLKSYADVMQGSENGPVVTAGNADQSPLAQMVINQKMPKRGPKLTPSETQIIVNWINQGALNN